LRRTALPLLLLLAGCGGSATNSVEEAAAPARSLTMESEDVVEGRRPVLTLICAPEGGSLSLALVRTPEAPPPARGVFGSFKVDDAAPQRVELTWLRGDRWAPRLDFAAEAALVRGIVAGRNVYFSGPEGTTDRAYRWNMGRVGPAIEEFRRACG